jgi:hypothetical protein
MITLMFEYIKKESPVLDELYMDIRVITYYWARHPILAKGHKVKK